MYGERVNARFSWTCLRTRQCPHPRSHMDQVPTFSALHLFRSQFAQVSKRAIITKRHGLFRLLNGDTFYPISCWPRKIRSIFWKKPIGDVETFKLILFFVGNGCSPHLISEWILSSQLWNNFQKGDKRSRQIDFILKNLSNKSNDWFYFDIYHNMWLHLNGEKRNTDN